MGEITVSVVGSKNPNWFDTHQIPQERRIGDSRRGCHPANDGFSGRNRPNCRDESRL